jgi:hypothetical protein
MSNFSKTGKREQVRESKREVKKRMRAVYKIMDELEEVATAIDLANEEWTEENIIEIAANHTELKLDGLEKLLLLGKLQRRKDAKNNDK